MIDLLPDTAFGPAMQALSERQQRFVLSLLEQRGRPSYAKAAREAGYSDIKEGAKVRGHFLAHDERVIAAIHEEARKRIESSAFMAANVLIEIAADESLEAKERRAAAGMLLDRSGLSVVTRQQIDVNHNHTDRTGAAMVERIKALAAKHGMDPGALLGQNAMGPAKRLPSPIEAEYQEVKGDG
jgi:phage terminase small subunit